MSAIIGRLALGQRAKARLNTRKASAPEKPAPQITKPEAPPAPAPKPVMKADAIAHMDENAHPEAPHKKTSVKKTSSKKAKK
jgi:hypothetical protein